MILGKKKKHFKENYEKNALQTLNSFICFEDENIFLSPRHDDSKRCHFAFIDLFMCLLYSKASLFARNHWAAVGGLWFTAVTREFTKERRKEERGVKSRLGGSTFWLQWPLCPGGTRLLGVSHSDFSGTVSRGVQLPDITYSLRK